MALLFSKVTLKSGSNDTEFLVGGVPANIGDLTGWVAFDKFWSDNMDDNIEVYVDTYRYGDAENYDATPEEIAYFMRRIQMNPDFIERRTIKMGSSRFDIKRI